MRSEEWNLLEHQKWWIKSCCTKAKATPPKMKKRENTCDEGRGEFDGLKIWLAHREAISEQ